MKFLISGVGGSGQNKAGKLVGGGQSLSLAFYLISKATSVSAQGRTGYLDEFWKQTEKELAVLCA